MKKLTTLLIKSKKSLIALSLIGLLGYTGWQISQIFNVAPDPAAVEARKTAGKNAVLKINTKMFDELKSSLQVSVDPSPGATGKSDPFNP